MSSSATPLPRPAMPLRQALSASEPLARLLHRLQASREALEAVRADLPPEIRALVQAGPWDEQQWTLFVHSAAAAAKLRQCLPALQARLQQSGRAAVAIRVKVLPRP